MTAEVYLSDEAEEEVEALDETQHRKLVWWAERLVEDVTVGDPVRKSLIPDRLRERYGLDNLWRLELPGGYRVLYTVVSSPNRPLTVSIVRILDHAAYDRLFGYSTS